MSERTTGLILRNRPLTETSLIVQWLTADFGRLSTVAKGGRRPKSPFHGKLDLFYLADFNFIRSRRSDLHILCEVGLQDTHPALRREMACLRQAAYCSALIEQTTETETPIPGVFGLFKSLLSRLPTGPAQPRTIFAFELRLLRELGLEPDLAKTNLSPAAKQLVQSLAQTDWPELGQLKPAQPQILEVRQFLHGFLIYHLGKIPHGRGLALKVEA
jgi:DNA repair protein RecO (recombination protein O)